MSVDPDRLPTDPLRRLEQIMALLRSPDGCPWDRRQDHRTLRPHLLEETYEVLAALDADPIDDEELTDELGDLLLQVVFHAQLAAEEDRFDLDDVAASIAEKLVRRHPHVFGTTEVAGAEDVLRNWETLKRAEGRASALGGVPPTLPALLRASRVLAKAERAGFRWSDRGGAAAKVEEEWGELTAAASDPVHASAELGDLLLALVTYAHHLDLDPEAALREAIERFSHRFRRMEEAVGSAGGTLAEADPDVLLRRWEDARDDQGQGETGEEAR
jgi:tetrapyrrole methylase family protein/MazG family protein